MRCSELQCVAVYYSVLQRVATQTASDGSWPPCRKNRCSCSGCCTLSQCATLCSARGLELGLKVQGLEDFEFRNQGSGLKAQVLKGSWVEVQVSNPQGLEGFRFRGQGSGLKVEVLKGLGFVIQVLWFRGQRFFRFIVQGSGPEGFRVQGLGLLVYGLEGFQVQGLGRRSKGLGFKGFKVQVSRFRGQRVQSLRFSKSSAKVEQRFSKGSAY